MKRFLEDYYKRPIAINAIKQSINGEQDYINADSSVHLVPNDSFLSASLKASTISNAGLDRRPANPAREQSRLPHCLPQSRRSHVHNDAANGENPARLHRRHQHELCGQSLIALDPFQHRQDEQHTRDDSHWWQKTLSFNLARYQKFYDDYCACEEYDDL